MIPEVVLHKALVQGIRAIREDSRVLDSMFKQMDQDILQSLKDVVLKQKLNLSINYPRADALKLPMISIILKSEAESHTFLGDVMGAGSAYGMPDSDLSYELLGGGVITGLAGLPNPLSEIFNVQEYSYNESTSRTRLMVLDPSGSALLLPEALPDSYLWVVAGTGQGEHLRVLNRSATQFTLSGVFTATLDSSSKVEIIPISNPEASIGEPSKVYDKRAKNLERRGANYDTQYQVSIVTGNQSETLYLYSVIKAILFSQKRFMEAQGIMALKISGTDFAPRSDFLPTEAFQRVMTLQFVYPFSYIEELDAYTTISVNLGTSASTSGTACNVTSFDISI